MPQRRTARKASQDIRAEDIGNQSNTFVKPCFTVGERTDSGGFLTPMLKGVKCQERQIRGAINATEADAAALLVRPVVELGRCDVDGS